MNPSTLTSVQDRFLKLWREFDHLGACERLLEWDQETTMPSQGVRARADILGTLAGLRHERLVSSELEGAVDNLAREVMDPHWMAQVHEARREIEKAKKVPKRLAEELASAKATGLAAWQEARKANDFSLFASHLDHLVRLKKDETSCRAEEGQKAYDVLLNDFEPGSCEEDLVPLFRELGETLTPLVQRIQDEGRRVSETPARGHFPVEQQREFGTEIAARFGFDFTAGRLDPSTHPFCLGVHHGDVRLTWRHQEDDFRPAFFGIIHETGHGLYEQGIPGDLASTPAGMVNSLTLHESQSRLWENMVGRSEAFWEWALPRFRHYFPDYSADLDSLWPALHVIQPSLIRVEADEATYHLHIAARFEIERQLFSGNLEVGDLPACWNETYENLLGLRPPTDSEGVLQDIHWSMGAFGYFPTYTTGTLASVQLFEAARSDIEDFTGALTRGDFAPLLEWLRHKVHRWGSLRSSRQMIQDATGRALTTEPYLAYIRGIAERVYF